MPLACASGDLDLSGGLLREGDAIDNLTGHGERYKLIYNALWQIPYTPVDFAGSDFWMELVEMNAAGKLSSELSRVYFSPTRPMFELFDLEKDPREFDNLAGKKQTAAIERELKAVLSEWMILERDYLPLPIPPAERKKKS